MPETPEETKTRTRTVTPRQYRSEVQTEMKDGNWEWRNFSAEPHEDTTAAKKFIREKGKAGKYRVIAVCWEGEVKVEQKAVTTLV